MKSAKALIDALVDAVQAYDTAVGRGGYYASEKQANYRKARKELRDALLDARKPRTKVYIPAFLGGIQKPG